MINRFVLWTGLTSGLIASGALGAGLGAGLGLEEASRLRAAQPEMHDGGQTPPWYVERSDNSSLSLSVLSQMRYTYNHRERGFVTGDDNNTVGFSLPRTRIALDGNIVSSQFNYRVSFDFGDAELSRGNNNAAFSQPSTGSAVLLDAYAQYNFAGKREGYYLKFGQYQSIVLTEEAIDSQYQLAIDRSMISEIFGPGYTQGVALGRVLNDYAWEIALNDGGRNFLISEAENTAFNDQNEADLGVSGRIDWKLKGDWSQFADFTSWRGSNEAYKIGAGFQYQFTGQSNPTDLTIALFPDPVDSSQQAMWTLDFQYENDGWSFFAAYVGQYVQFQFPTGAFRPDLSFQNNAVLLQASWFAAENVEWYARFETFWIDKEYRNAFGQPDGDIFRLLTAGVTRYLLPESHAAKLSMDVSYSFDPTTVLSIGSTSVNLPDPAVTGFLGLTEEEIVIRAQLQLVF